MGRGRAAAGGDRSPIEPVALLLSTNITFEADFQLIAPRRHRPRPAVCELTARRSASRLAHIKHRYDKHRYDPKPCWR
jgi:hypothetical protein